MGCMRLPRSCSHWASVPSSRSGSRDDALGFFLKVIRIGTPVMLGLIAVLGILAYDREVLTEARALAALPAADPAAPNVLMIVLDTVSAEHLSLYGYAKPTTPQTRRAGPTRSHVRDGPRPGPLDLAFACVPVHPATGRTS